jgi:hypothetical protein
VAAHHWTLAQRCICIIFCCLLAFSYLPNTFLLQVPHHWFASHHNLPFNVSNNHYSWCSHTIEKVKNHWVSKCQFSDNSYHSIFKGSS